VNNNENVGVVIVKMATTMGTWIMAGIIIATVDDIPTPFNFFSIALIAAAVLITNLVL
jgi:hypothetical protein